MAPEKFPLLSPGLEKKSKVERREMQRLLETSRRYKKDGLNPENSNRLRNKLIILLTLAALVFCVIAVATSKNDSTSSCTPPYNIAKFRGIGVGSGAIFSRIIAFREDVDPLVSVPDPLTVIDTLSNATEPQERESGASSLVWAWLQFLEHDLSKPESFDGAEENGLLDFRNLTRDNRVLDSHGNIQTINYATPFIDLSQIYGNTIEEATALRRMDGTGKLITTYSGNGNVNDSEVLPELNNITFAFVDNRSTDNLLVAALYTLFVREHNYWCDELHGESVNLSDFEYYNTARHITIATFQAITYRVVLPLLIGDLENDDNVHCFDGIEKVKPGATVDDYVHRVSVFNEAATALFPMYTALATPTPTTNVYDTIANDGIGGILVNASMQRARRRNEGRIVSQFKEDAAEVIARTRDHQIPLYVSYRYHYMKKAHSPCQFYTHPETCALLEEVYGEEGKDTDLFTGMLVEHNSENHKKALLGEVGRRLASEQFSYLKHNDHYFYRWDRIVKPRINAIHHSNLAMIIARNTGIDYQSIRHDLFTLPDD